MGGMLGVYFTRDLWFTIYVFLVQHYLILWAALEIYLMSDTMQYRFIFNMALWFFFGAIVGVMVTWALGNRVSVPVHLFNRQKFKPGTLLLTVGLVWAPRAAVIALDAYDPNDNLDDDPSKPLYWVVTAIWALLAIVVLIITGIQKSTFPWYINAFALMRYDDEKDADKGSDAVAESLRSENQLITGNVVWLVLVLSAQAIWDFAFPGTTSPADDKARFALYGSLTLLFETLVWWGMYGIYRAVAADRAKAFFALDKWIATSDGKYDGLFWFTLVGFLIQILSGLGFLIYGLVFDQTDILQSSTVLVVIGSFIAAIAGIFVIVHWVMYDRKKSTAYTPVVNPTTGQQMSTVKKTFHAA
jgi:hypothetical protein